MNTIEGDLVKFALNGRFDVIVHGCNCFNTMGAGIARQIKKFFPQAYARDNMTIKGDIKKLGNYTSVTAQVKNGKHVTIINGYTQYKYWGNGQKTDYDAIRKLFRKIKNNYSGKSIAFPKIGSGLGGGEWQIVSQIINEELYGENYTFVKYSS